MKAAIYSRKSKYTGVGESIENQIQMCKEYGKKMGVTEYLVYEDEGFSAKNIDRPEFQKMLQDAKKKKFNVLICYRLDRVSRNIADFSVLIEDLQKLDISFVSIREQFDTSTPMGRAMMYIASVFAQLERETIAERVRDNMIELSKTGRWLGGVPPLGFKSFKIIEDGKIVTYLEPIEEELEVVKLVFKKYQELKSLYKTAKYFKETQYNCRSWSVQSVGRIISAPNYVISDLIAKQYLENLNITVIGEMNGNGLVPYNQRKGVHKYNPMDEWIFATGQHKGIIPSDEWIWCQNHREKRKADTSNFFSSTTNKVSFLTGIFKCAKCGQSMRVQYGPKRKDGTYPLYYTCKNHVFFKSCENKNVRMDKIDNIVIDYLNNLQVSDLNIEFKKADKSESKKVKKTIEKNDTAIQNLVKQMAILSVEASTYIVAELEKLSKENSILKSKLLELERENDNENLQELNKQIFINQISNFKNEFKKCKTIDAKRQLMQSMVKKVTWDSETKMVDIQLLE